DDLGRKMTVRNQTVLAVEIGDHLLQKLGALDEPGFKRPPLGFVDEHRHMAQRPGALGRTGCAVLAIKNAGVVELLVAAGEAARGGGAAESGQIAQERPPDWADASLCVEQLI